MCSCVHELPEVCRKGRGPEEEGETVEVPHVELVVEGAGEDHAHQVGGEEHPQHVWRWQRP